VENVNPISGVDYPRMFQEMDDWFRSEAGRRSQTHGLLFHRLAQQTLAVGPAPYHSIISGTPHVLG